MMRFRHSAAETSHNLGTLSISSLAGSNTGIDDGSEDADFDQTAELYQRLHDLEEMTQTFLNERPIRLNNQHDSFTDVDKGSKQDFELIVSEFLHEEVLCLSVVCIPDTVNDETVYLYDEGPKTIKDHQPLDVKVYRVSSLPLANSNSITNTQQINQDISFLPTLHNAEYSFSLTSAIGMIPGLYHLSIQNLGISTQPIRVSHKILPLVRAVSLRPDQKVIGCNGSNEYSYYKITVTNPSQLITIRAKPATNRFNGLVEVNKENCVWKSNNVGGDRIDIHPNDVDVRRGNTFIIGVWGYKEKNEFEVEVTLSDPKPIRSIELGDSIDIQLPSTATATTTTTATIAVTEEAKYFSYKVNSTNKSKVYMMISPLQDINQTSTLTSTSTSSSNVNFASVNQTYGRCVYATDSLAPLGVFGTDMWPDGRGSGSTLIPPIPSIIKAQSLNNNSTSMLASTTINTSSPNTATTATTATSSVSATAASLFAAALPQSLPPSICLDKGVFPVAYLSGNCMYPGIEDFSWRGSSVDGRILIVFENEEWKYTSGICYMSLQTLRLPTSTSTTTSSNNIISDSYLNCRITIWEKSYLDEISAELREKYDIFSRIYRDIDGSNISQKERNRVGREDQALTYGEVEFLPFVNILRAAGANSGDAFYDLGCGAGKAVVSAALSGISFSRCI
eukprot:gene10897-22748_t